MIPGPSVLNDASSKTRMGRTMPPEVSTQSMYLAASQFREVAVAALQSVLYLLRLAKMQETCGRGDAFDVAHHPAAAPFISDENLVSTLNTAVRDIFDKPEDAELRNTASKVILRLLSAHSVSSILPVLDEVDRLYRDGARALRVPEYAVLSLPSRENGFPFSSNGPTRTSSGDSKTHSRGTRLGTWARSQSWAPSSSKLVPYFHLAPTSQLQLQLSWRTEFGPDLLRASAGVAHALRKDKRNPSFEEFLAFHVSYWILNQGKTPFDAVDAPALGPPGFRRGPMTSVCLADPGPGHFLTTTRQERWMHGTLLHVEHPRRTPSIVAIMDFARTRLHAGTDGICTFFVGRARKDDLNTVSSAAHAAFQLGAAECVVDLSGMKASALLSYMEALDARTPRSHLQHFSCVFDLSTPILDDIVANTHGNPRLVTSATDIARRGMELAALGGFNKCILRQGKGDETHGVRLGFKKALELTHLAHSLGLMLSLPVRGLEHDVDDAVFAGVDAISSSWSLSTLSAEGRIAKILAARDTLSRSIRAQGANLLSRLDVMYFEGSIDEDEEELRQWLYHTLLRADEQEIARCLSSDQIALDVLSLPTESKRPWVGRARRILRNEDPALRQGADTLPDARVSETMWSEFDQCLQWLVDREDEQGVYSYSLTGHWKLFHKRYTSFVDRD